MNGLLHREIPRDWPCVDVLLISGVALAGRIGYWLYGGTRLGKDTSGYLLTCSAWVNNPLDALTGQLVGVEYAGFTLPFCLVVDFLGAPYETWVAIQILLSVLSCLIVYATARRVLDRIAGIAAGLSMAVLWESFQWTIYLLSDATFVFAVTVALWAVTRYRELGTRRAWTAAWLALAYVAVTRPFGLPIVIGWLAYDLLPRGNEYRGDLLSKPAYMFVLVGAIGLYYAATSRGAWVDSTMYSVWADGVLVKNDPTFRYSYSPVGGSSPLTFVLYNAHHLIAMGVSKIGLFFLPVVPRWSTLHNVVNVVTLLPMMLASGWAIVHQLRRGSQLFRLWVTPLVVILLVVGVTFVDWDWRYRAPAAPVFSLLVGYTTFHLRPEAITNRWRAIRR